MKDQEIAMIYPTFQIIEGRASIIPRINLPKDYLQRVKLFYEQGRRQVVEAYSSELERFFTETSPIRVSPEIRLQWGALKGLTNISIGCGAGFDLNDDGWPSFQEHNLDGRKAIIAASIATKYVSELLKTSNK